MDPNNESYMTQGNPEITTPKKENVLAGAIGALLLSLVGGAIVFLLTRINIIAGIAGLIGFIATYWGYQKFSGVKGSKIGIVISVIFTLLSVFIGLYLGYAFDVFQEMKGYGASFGDALKLLKTMIETNSDVRGGVIKDSLILLAFTALSCIGTIGNTLKNAKK